MKKEPVFNITHYMIIDGVKTEIDPMKVPEIADRCKLAWAHITTDNRYVLVDPIQKKEHN